MPMPEKIILSYIESLLRNSIRILKDRAYQQRVWFRAEGPECSTYIDVTIHFIDGCESIFKMPVCAAYLGEENYALLQKLYQLTIEHVDLTESRINPDLLEEDVLMNDPKWHEIQALAAEIYPKLTEFVKRQNYE